MKYRYIFILALVVLPSCASMKPKTVGDLYKWPSLSPPRASVLGREIVDGNILDPIVEVNDENTERIPSVGSITSEQQKKYSASAEAAAAAATAKLGFSYISSEQLSATDLEISQIHNYINSISVNRTFVFQCLNAKEQKFNAESTSGGSATIDVSKLAEQFGVDVAKVEINSKPEKPNKVEVKISNPNVCFAYKTARFQDDNDYIIGTLADKYIDITGNGSSYTTEFMLALGDKSNWRSPHFLGRRQPASKPWYRLVAVKGEKSGELALAVCKQGRGMGDRGYSCKELEEDGYGNWDRPYFVDVFSYGDQKYKEVWININAKREADRIKVISAKMQYPQYILKIE